MLLQDLSLVTSTYIKCTEQNGFSDGSLCGQLIPETRLILPIQELQTRHKGTHHFNIYSADINLENYNNFSCGVYRALSLCSHTGRGFPVVVWIRAPINYC